jgi:hypothetical protein
MSLYYGTLFYSCNRLKKNYFPKMTIALAYIKGPRDIEKQPFIDVLILYIYMERERGRI